MHILRHPLSSWALALFIIAALPTFQLLSGGLLSGVVRSSPAENHSDKNLHGLLITTSGLYCALNNGRSNRAENIISLQSIYMPLASVSSFTNLENAIAKANPDFIVVHGSVLTGNQKTTKARLWLRQLKQFWIATLSDIHPLVKNTFIKLQCTFGSLDEALYGKHVKLGKESQSTTTNTELHSQLEFFKTLLSFNKPIIVANQPHPHIAQTYKTLVNNSVARIIEKTGVSDPAHQLDYSVIHPNSFFYDPYHPTPELTDLYIAWFNSQVIRLLKQ